MTHRYVSASRVAGRKPAADAPARQSRDAASRSVRIVVGGRGGQPLGDEVRAVMEPALGFDLSTVRVHTDQHAAASAAAVGAQAYTVAEDIVFGTGRYQPASSEGQRLLAHELTHVVQQRNGPVSGASIGEGLSVSDPSDAFEKAAEANADRIMSGGTPLRGQPGGSPGVALQPHISASSNGQLQRAPQEVTVNPGVMTGASKKYDDIMFYEWNWAVTVDGQAWLFNEWIDTNDPRAEPELRQSVIERLKSGHRENLQGIM